MKKLVTALALVLTGLATWTTAAQAETVLTKAELTVALQQAEAAGTIESVEVAAASQEAVEAAFAPGERELNASVGVPDRAYASLALVVMRGHFEDVTAKVPHGAPFPTGSVMTFVVNRGTGRIAALSVQDSAPAIPSGATIERPSVTASMKARSASLRRWAARTRAQATGERTGRRERAHTATWGNNCKAEPSYDHCYVVAEWDMKGVEEVYGGDTEQRHPTSTCPAGKAATLSITSCGRGITQRVRAPGPRSGSRPEKAKAAAILGGSTHLTIRSKNTRSLWTRHMSGKFRRKSVTIT